MAHVEKSVSMQHFEQYVRKQRRAEVKSVGNFVAKTVLVESANQFSLEELCRTQYILKYFSKPYIDHQTLWKNFNQFFLRTKLFIVFFLNNLYLITVHV